jgi:hypothetical protein
VILLRSSSVHGLVSVMGPEGITALFGYILKGTTTMKCFHCLTEFISTYSWEVLPGAYLRSIPRTFVVEYDDGRQEVTDKPPRSYRRVSKALCIVGNHIAERVHGFWVECPSPRGRRWLFQRALREAVDRLQSEGLCFSASVPFEANGMSHPLNYYLKQAMSEVGDAFGQKVTEAMALRMDDEGEFDLLNCYGDSLQNAPD